MKDLTPDTALTMDWGGDVGDCTVRELVADNAHDFDLVQELLRDLIDHGHSRQGGGAFAAVTISVR